MHRIVIPTIAAILAVLTAGCGTVSNYFGDEENAEPPAELVKIDSEIQIKTLWNRRVGSGVNKQYLKLHPVIHEGRVFAAARKGTISAYDASNGDVVWEKRVKLPISGGPGAGAGLVVVGSSDGDVLALSADRGEELWRTRVSSEILSTPGVSPHMVVVRTIDGKLFGLDSKDGARIWVYDRTVPILSLRGTSSPVLTRDAVVAGFDSGRLVSVSLDNGQPLWETRIAVPRGRSELERMVDIDADPVVADGTVYAATFQGRLAALDLETGAVLWRRDMSSHAGIGVTRKFVYVTDDQSHIWALDRRNSSSMWRQSKLEHRAVTSPVGFKDFVVVADFEGYVHWLSRDDGRLLARIRVDSDGVMAPPIATADAVYIYGKSGELTALTVGQ